MTGAASSGPGGGPGGGPGPEPGPAAPGDPAAGGAGGQRAAAAPGAGGAAGSGATAPGQPPADPTAPGQPSADATARADAVAGPGGAGADAAAGATSPGEEMPADVLGVLDQTQRERDEYLDALRRLQADFENYRKRVQRQQEESVSRAAERLVIAMLPALDAFDLAAEHLVGDETASPGGLLQAASLLRDTLAKEGVERVGDVGEPFDPTAHEAVDHAADDDGDGPVVEAVLRHGYRFNGRVVRPAMVKVRG